MGGDGLDGGDAGDGGVDGSLCDGDVCVPCGGAGAVCCTGNACSTGYVCQVGGGGGAGVCVQCGGAGQACCAANHCGDGCCVNNVCVSASSTCPGIGASCASGSCGTCGGAGQPCCTGAGGGGDQCTASGVVCSNGSCVTCGASGQPCCAGDMCTDAGVGCTAGHVCGQCGGPGQACCANDTCTRATARTTPAPGRRSCAVVVAEAAGSASNAEQRVSHVAPVADAARERRATTGSVSERTTRGRRVPDMGRIGSTRRASMSRKMPPSARAACSSERAVRPRGSRATAPRLARAHPDRSACHHAPCADS
jgi:hypothetical protein